MKPGGIVLYRPDAQNVYRPWSLGTVRLHFAFRSLLNYSRNGNEGTFSRGSSETLFCFKAQDNICACSQKPIIYEFPPRLSEVSLRRCGFETVPTFGQVKDVRGHFSSFEKGWHLSIIFPFYTSLGLLQTSVSGEVQMCRHQYTLHLKCTMRPPALVFSVGLSEKR